MPRKFPQRKKYSKGRTQSGKWLEAFLQKLRETGNVRRSCEEVGIGRRTAYNYKNTDVEFAEAWESALEDYNDLLVDEIDRRGRRGFEEPVFFQGVEVSQVTKYSDNLLMFEAKKRMPAYRDRVAIEEDLKTKFLEIIARYKLTKEQIEADDFLREVATEIGYFGNI